MKTQMRFQKYLCLAMLILGAIATVYALCYFTGSMEYLGKAINQTTNKSFFKAGRDTNGNPLNDATLYLDMQWFGDLLMYFGIIMILLAVLLYITACNKRRNYYVSNYVATGVCAGGNIALSLTAIILNAMQRAEFLNVNFANWKAYCDEQKEFEAIMGTEINVPYSESTAMFDLGFAVYILVILASVVLILNLVWKIKLMQGERKLLASENLAGGVV